MPYLAASRKGAFARLAELSLHFNKLSYRCADGALGMPRHSCSRPAADTCRTASARSVGIGSNMRAPSFATAHGGNDECGLARQRKLIYLCGASQRMSPPPNGSDRMHGSKPLGITTVRFSIPNTSLKLGVYNSAMPTQHNSTHAFSTTYRQTLTAMRSQFTIGFE